VVIKNCDEVIDNFITPLIHHRNTTMTKDREEGQCDLLARLFQLLTERMMDMCTLQALHAFLASFF